MKRHKTAGKLASILAMFFAISPLHAACQLNAVAVLPIQEAGAPFVFAAKVNGKPANLSIETGNVVTTVNHESSERLDVDLHLSERPTFGIGGPGRSYFGTIDRLTMGGMTARDLRVRGSDLGPPAYGPGLDGQLGMDVLESYNVDLDIAGQHVVIYEAHGACSTPNVALQPPLYMVNLVDITHDRQADVDVVIEGQHFRAMLDSGLGHTSMFRSAALRLGLSVDFSSAPGHAFERGMGPSNVAYVPHVFKTMQIGDLTFNNSSIRVLEQNGTGIDRHRTGSLFAQDNLTGGHEIILGADFMRKVHLWISHSSHTLIMQYPPQPSVLPH